MAQSIKISDADMEILRKEAERASRSIAGQVAHWIRIGRSIERASEFSHARVRQALDGKRSPDALSGEEQIVYVDEVFAAAAAETPEQAAFFEQRRQAGRGVGADKNGALVRASKARQTKRKQPKRKSA